MYLVNKELVYSPSDLIVFMKSAFASWMDRYEVENPGVLVPDKADEGQERLFRRGLAHEAGFLERLRAEGREVCEIARDERAEALTVAAMREGHEIIYQGYLRNQNFAGWADFLVRVDGGYEPWDTKLARKTKPHFAVQLCCYAEMLERVQGRRPEHFRVVLGDGSIRGYRTEDYFYYYRAVKEAFLELQATFDPERRPEPAGKRDHFRWNSHAKQILEEVDHLCRVANITALQIKKLQAVGIGTLAALAAYPLERAPFMDAAVFQRLRGQARLQQASTETLRYEILEGGLRLPPVAPGDVYFDMEGYPWLEDRLEYLFGAWCRDEGFREWWAHDAGEERRAFEGFVDWAHARWKACPEMHIYHYADYEKSALRRLAGRHGTREAEVDDLLRNEVLVDLYAVVRHGVRVGGRDYSLKTLEKVYRGGRRETDVASAMDSMVAYERWLESGESRDWRDSPLLAGIREYNRDDCESTTQLADWLRSLQCELAGEMAAHA